MIKNDWLWLDMINLCKKKKKSKQLTQFNFTALSHAKIKIEMA